MAVMLLAFLLAFFVLPCVLMPDQIWSAFNAGDDVNDFGFRDVNIVVLRNPVRESGPPVCMAKLIMLRHKAGQRKRVRPTHPRHSRSVSRTNGIFPQRPRAFSWMKFGKQMH